MTEDAQAVDDVSERVCDKPVGGVEPGLRFDPDAALDYIRYAISEAYQHWDMSEDAQTLLETVDRLDTWMTAGGPPPGEWNWGNSNE